MTDDDAARGDATDDDAARGDATDDDAARDTAPDDDDAARDTGGDDAAAGDATVDDTRPDSPGPLGDLRDRVVDEPERSPTSFPDESTSASGIDGTGSDGTADGTESDGTADGTGSDGTADGDDDWPALNPADEEAARSGPLGDLAAGVDERRERKTRTDEDLFDEVDVGEVDSDALWEQVRTEAPDVGAPEDRQVREVDKHKYCQRCPHFSAPPDVGCTHEGTDILEQVDMETFEVADCPIILEDERLEDATTAESGPTE